MNWLSKKLIDRYYLSLCVIVLDLNNEKHNGEIRRCYLDESSNTIMYKIYIASKFIIVLSYKNLKKLAEGTLSGKYVQVDFIFNDKTKEESPKYINSLKSLGCNNNHHVLANTNSNISLRNVKGTSNLYYIENNKLLCTAVSACRCTKELFHNEHPLADAAFCANPNVHNDRGKKTSDTQ